MAWPVELGDKELTDVHWPPRCSVLRHQSYANEVARLNGLQAKKTFFLRGG